jgi:hypothetical protein
MIVDAAVNPDGGYLVNSGGTLGGTGTITGPVTVNSGGFLVPGDPNGTLSVSNIVATGGETIIVSNANLSVAGQIGSSLGSVGSLYLTNATLSLPLLLSGASAFASTLTVDGKVTLTYSSSSPAIGQFPLIAYSSLGGLAGGGTNGITLVSPAGTSAYLSNNAASSTLDVVVSAIPALIWRGTPGNSWDIGSSTDWLISGAPTTYTESSGVGPFVTFDDTAAGSTSVNVTTTVSPKGVTLSNTNKNYSLSGTGKISGQ